MKRYSLWFTIAAISLWVMAFNTRNVKDCAKIKNGKFYYYSKTSRDKVNIERQGNVQLEEDTKTGQVLKNKLTWTGDCSYELYINALSEDKLNKIDSLISITPTLVEITDVNSDYYVCMWKLTVLNKDFQGIDTIYIEGNQKK